MAACRPERVNIARVLLPFTRRAAQTMGMPQSATRWTAEMVRALPADGNRYEVIDGELLVTPAPSWSHQYVVGDLYFDLRSYVDRIEIGVVMMSPADIELDGHGLVQPDVFVLGLIEGSRPCDWNVGAPLLLAAEVLSPATARSDRITKRRRFLRHGVPEYWIVDSDARTIERWRPHDERPEIISEVIEWLPAGAPEPWRLDLPAFFARHPISPPGTGR